MAVRRGYGDPVPDRRAQPAFDVNVWNITHELLCGDTVRLGQVLTSSAGKCGEVYAKGGEIYLDITGTITGSFICQLCIPGQLIPAWA